MASVKLMLTRCTLILICLLGYYPVVTVSQSTITLEGYFGAAATKPLSVLAANPTATTLIGTNTLTITFEGHPTIGTQIGISYGTQTGTIVYIYVFGPSTAASIELLPGLSATDACVLTSSWSTGNCVFRRTALNTDNGMSIWTEVYETYTNTVPRTGTNYYTVTAGLEKLSIGATATTTPTSSISPTPSTSSTSSISSATSASVSASPTVLPTSNPASNSSMIAPTTGIPTMPTVSGAIVRHDIQFLRNAILGLSTIIVVAVLSFF